MLTHTHCKPSRLAGGLREDARTTPRYINRDVKISQWKEGMGVFGIESSRVEVRKKHIGVLTCIPFFTPSALKATRKGVANERESKESSTKKTSARKLTYLRHNTSA